MTYILFIAVIILIYLLISGQKEVEKNKSDLQVIINSLNSKIKNFENEKENLNQKIASLEDNNIALKKYQGIVDTEQKIKDILLKANLEAATILENAKKELENAVLEAKSIKSKANVDATNFKQNAVKFLNDATSEAKLIIEQAYLKADEISGDAYKSMRNTRELEKTARAMTNIIEGYGYKYLISYIFYGR